ncbi:MAG: ribosomal protein S18 acetylase RimI-like enzyme [Candidatus Azotimanducaceae bacterium]|jgi:ribosomal protein S18 acetylase RimI-like enzyme
MTEATTDVIVRPFIQAEWQQYRDTRLSALQDSPDAFGSVYETTALLADSEWQDRLARITPDRDLSLAGLVGTEFAGMAWARFDQPEDTIVHLYQMWVSPAHRGKGLAHKLLLEALAWALSKDAKGMSLGVTCGDTPARKLYASVGFEAIGTPEPLRTGSDLKVQTMEYMFRK